MFEPRIQLFSKILESIYSLCRHLAPLLDHVVVIEFPIDKYTFAAEVKGYLADWSLDILLMLKEKKKHIKSSLWFWVFPQLTDPDDPSDTRNS